MRIDSIPVSSQVLNGDAVPNSKAEEANKAAKDFESMFFGILMKNMRATARPEDQSNAMDVYQDMLDGEYVKSMGEGKGVGVRDMILDWMRTTDPSIFEGNSAEKGGGLNELGKNSAAARAAIDEYRAQAQMQLPKSR